MNSFHFHSSKGLLHINFCTFGKTWEPTKWDTIKACSLVQPYRNYDRNVPYRYHLPVDVIGLFSRKEMELSNTAISSLKHFLQTLQNLEFTYAKFLL